ncbi:molybdenum cofactor biosynthesis protein B [Bordetella avium]|uniref:Molybdenum cofactor biosynthesis protein B n=1 Tax=Bordetella avium (strain 197N) TaxID=360910 RepID=Q2KWG9_BORA1|nr:molybdenum cofactor biosynthesis protein B [Bordetella avium]AZY48352.1 molybdenum cofactor biosynthesis protein B [Bordetella avium]AZY51733.1 molybdenum cofactor biosynthesis protein B [Bordetella avium]RIQ13405.1 molybdenum cofactor biosynthesis protein B [Bordetella avium]RIQ15957.1 molybdenum cofactor biosynthesis protein B [Bordetella avium]RIQ30175.1 molybdenum cofactor biosynthesis protein B [Bordetella avium]
MNANTPIPLVCAVLTISDTRSPAEDTSGDLLAEHIVAANHHCAHRAIVPDDIYQIRRVLSDWIANPEVQVILTNGGTGFSPRNCLPEAVRPLFDREIEGFGELFRQISYDDIGSSTIQSRALAGYANQTVIFCMPGSTRACKTAWTRIIAEQLDSRYKPCNFATQLSRKDAS